MPPRSKPSGDVQPAAPKPTRDRRKPIARTSRATGAWWCPFCDMSHESKVVDCRCGARRDGDEALR